MYLNKHYLVYSYYKMVRATNKSVVSVDKSKVPPKKVSPKKDLVPDEVKVLPVDPVVVSVVDDVVSSLDKSSLSGLLLEEIASFNTNYAAWMSSAVAMKLNIKNIAKMSLRVSKNVEKTSKRKKSTSSGKLSGFEKPTLISDDLAVFFDRPVGSLMARTEVSKSIHKYVTEHNLQDEKNRRIIHPDAKLLKLLECSDDELTYFNLQKYLKHHFKKEVMVASV
jgi:hypothetical protein